MHVIATIFSYLSAIGLDQDQSESEGYESDHEMNQVGSLYLSSYEEQTKALERRNRNATTVIRRNSLKGIPTLSSRVAVFASSLALLNGDEDQADSEDSESESESGRAMCMFHLGGQYLPSHEGGQRKLERRCSLPSCCERQPKKLERRSSLQHRPSLKGIAPLSSRMVAFERNVPV